MPRGNHRTAASAPDRDRGRPGRRKRDDPAAQPVGASVRRPAPVLVRQLDVPRHPRPGRLADRGHGAAHPALLRDRDGGIDAALYYSLIRHLAPKRVIEIGSGQSTRIANLAFTRNQAENKQGRLTCIEPNPERLLDQKQEIELLQQKVEEIPRDYFACLEANDILFIDSTHTVKFGSDVCYEFLEILPTLKPGVWVHVHDIFFPNDYPAEWILERRLAWNEQYLLEAFLSFSNAYSVEIATHWLSLDYPDVVTALYPEASTMPGLASSFWIRRN